MWLNNLQKEIDLKVKVIKCDNSGENRKLQEIENLDKGLKNKFEYTALNTPEQNGKIEKKFQTLYAMIRAMLNWAPLPSKMRAKLWAQCATVDTKLENIIVKDSSNSTSYETFDRITPTFTNYLRNFDEIGIVHDGKKIRGKLTDHGIPCMFIG
jgi:hypothetical protein